MLHRKFTATFVIVAGSLVGTYAMATDNRAAQRQIRKIDRQWAATVATKDPVAIARYYTEDGAILPPNAPIAQGRSAIAKAWEGFVSLRDFSLAFAPTKIDVAPGGAMAYEIGEYKLTFTGEGGPVTDEGKFVVVWKKTKGTWKAAADIFNSNRTAK